MQSPSIADLRVAAEWLKFYEDGEEAEACARVAVWLEHQAQAKEVRELAKENGVSVSMVRKAIAKVSKE